MVCGIFFRDIAFKVESKVYFAFKLKPKFFPNRFVKTCCFMSNNTAIATPNITVSFTADEAMEGMWLEKNKAIQYLPIQIYEIFPNLREYWARECQIKAISKKNFKKLAQLKELFLSSNLIETVPSNAFEDLIKLRWVRLGNETQASSKRYPITRLTGSMCPPVTTALETKAAACSNTSSPANKPRIASNANSLIALAFQRITKSNN